MIKQWYVLYTKARNEKKTALILEKSGIDVYCPIVKEVRQWSDRKKTVEVPLFSSYLFVHLAPKERELVYAAPGVVRYLFWLNRPAIVKEHEIDTLKRWLSGKVLSANIQNLKAGDCLSISKGPFKGKEGVIQRVNTKRVQLVLKELGLKVSITTQDAICA
jgi:transcription antitermination factor NusG